MAWKSVAIATVVCGLISGCGPDGSAGSDSDTDESSSGGSGDTAPGDSTPPTATSPTSATMTDGSMSGSMSGGTSDGDGSAADTTPPPPDSSGGATDTAPATDSGGCPYGTEGCLCDVGAACDEGLDCNRDGICVAPPACRPIDTDPHDDEASAIALDMLACGAGMDLGLIGTVEGPQTDWYTFFGNDAFGCPEQPAAVVTADTPLVVCVYIACDGGTSSNVACDMDSMMATSPDGAEGCCGDGAAQITGYDCFGGFSGKDVDAWISVGTEDAVCVDYELAYAF